MKTILPNPKLKQAFLFVLLLLFISITHSFAQDTFDGEYCPGPGLPGDEYATGTVFSQQLNPSPSSTCQIGTIRAKVNTTTQVLRLGMNIGNGGAALFRLYLDTDNNSSTGLTSDTFGGPLSVAGAEFILEINSNANTFNLYSGNGNVKTQLTVNNGLAALNGSATGCNAGGGSFLEFNIPFGSLNIDICDPNNPGLINITKLASVSGNSASSSRCIDTPLTFGIPLKGSIGPDATVCAGTNSSILNFTGVTDVNIIKWQYLVSPFSPNGWLDTTIPNTTTTHTETNLTETTKYRVVFSKPGLCGGNNIYSSEATITVNPAPIITISSQTNVLCYNASTGAINISVSGGTAPYSYAWTGTGVIATAMNQTGLKAGNYEVTVTDAKGCKAIKTFTITQPQAALTASITSQTNVNCFGAATGSVTVVGANGTSPYTYSKDGTNFVGSGTFTNLTAGSYTITVKDANGCTLPQAVTITQPQAALTASITSQTNVNCFGAATGSVTVVGANGTSPYTYSKDGTNFVGSGTFTNLIAGSYTITVKDANGCTIPQAVTITQPQAALTASITSQTNVNCFGAATGSVTVVGANGTSPYTYSKDGTNFVGSGTFTNLIAGSYTITVKDANGCTLPQAVTITQPQAALTASITSQTNVNCFGAATGSVTVVGANGTSPYTYSKDGTNFVGSGTFTNLIAGSYTITVKDANGCTLPQAVTITQPQAALTASITSQTNVNCFGAATGSVTVVGANGTSPYTYSKDGTNFVGNGTFTNLIAGSYTITVKDANGCTLPQAVTITQPQAALTASITSQTNVNCFGAATGSVTVVGANGTSPYTYSKDGTNFVGSGTFTNLIAGSYTITVKDANGCTLPQAVTITQPQAALTASITSQTNVNCFGAATGSVTVVGANGTSPYTYSKDGTNFVGSGTFTNLIAGSYTITVKDANGCTLPQAVTITQPQAALTASITSQTNVNCFGAATGSVTVVGANGTSPYTYSKDGTNFVGSGTFTNLIAGSYTITVKDVNGCTLPQAVTITQPQAAISCSVTQDKAVSANGLSDGQATVTALGGNGGYTYLWDNNETTATATALNAGVHSVTVTDSKGCNTTCQVTITQPGVLSCSITQNSPAKCFGDSNGIATVTPLGGNGDYTFLWDNGETTAQAVNLNAGLHTVTVTDKLGYNTTCTVTIGQPIAALSATAIIINNNNCVGCSNGSINISPVGGTTPYTFNWSNGATTEDISSLPKGKYDVEIKDINGCTVNYTYFITESGIELLKDADYEDTNNDGIINIGDNIVYKFKVTNIGNVTITNVTVTDNKATVTGGPIVSLPAGVSDSNTFMAVHAITQDDINKGLYYNLALTSAKDPENITVTDTSSDPTPCSTCPIDPECPDCTITVLNQSPSISITKDGTYVDSSLPSGTSPGDTVTYAFVVKNTGNVTLTNITITDDNVNIVGTLAMLAPGDSNSTAFTAEYTITQADIDTGQVDNLAIAKGNPPIGNPVTAFSTDPTPCVGCTPIDPSCTSCTITELTRTPKIVIVKTNDIIPGSNGCATLAVNDVVKYTFTVTNAGNVSLHDIAVIDNLPGLSAIALTSGDSNNNAILDVNEIWIYNATYTVTQADIDAGKITNQATVNGKTPDDKTVIDQSGSNANNDDANEIPICTSGSIAIVKTNDIIPGTNGCATLAVDDVVKYTFTVTNTGNVSLNNIAIIDNHPGLSAITFTSGDSNNNNILDVNEIWIYNATYTVTQSDIDLGHITNQATVNGKTPDDKPVTDQSGSNTNNNDENVIPICTSGAIAIVKTNDIIPGTNGCATLAVDDVVKYTFTVTNTGNVSLHDIAVIDNHPGLSAITLTNGDSNTNNLLEVNEIWIYNATYSVTQADINNGKITNQATVNGKTPDDKAVTDQSGSDANNNDEDIIPICTNPSVTITKDGTYVDTNNDGKTNVGDIISYKFIVTNTGNLPLTNVTVTDNNAVVSGGPITTLAVGASDSTTFSAIHAITQDDINKGIVYNLALATGTPPIGDPITATSTDPTPCTSCPKDPECPDCTITLLNQNPLIIGTLDGTFVDSNGNGIADVGETITYTIVVTNTGNVTLTDVTIIDTFLPGVVITGDPITLQPNIPNSTNFTGTYTITQADIDAGYVYNIIITTGTPPQGEEIDNSSTDPTPCLSCPVNPDCVDCTITPVPQKAELVVVKTSNTPAYSSVGDIINYTIQVQNTGNVTLSNIKVTDPLTGLNQVIATLEPGTYQEYNENYTVKQEDRVNLSVTNVAFADGFTPNQTPISASDSEVVEANIVLGCGSITVHNAFSPNGDGINETFIIDNIDDVLCYPTNSVEIYNRWGVLVFETSGYDNVTKAFKGISEGRTTISQSSRLPAGTYFYILHYTSIDGLNNSTNNTKDGYLYLTR
ncbi:gliding motility-associated C-terminal domain-containing protein [Flavobacterium sp. NG2]|uniref:DUF7507 domain-containing protein n=1 Tax=Flavobacterium sp. NG2 TaxID=3097547 RepID=UPI002A81FF7C|nr:gliding motility-associated C-terminal domain-containing protein [Flavobacterium sp. NG2]WPR70458.1 gliding motility-associated C-terminal domain-containing protein [Flavobacterium sp. NG2]